MKQSHRIFVLALLIGWAEASFKFQNLECKAEEPSTLSITECRIKAMNRSRNLLTIIYHVKQTLEKEIKINFQFVKRERGGWHPFLYGMTVELCSLLDGSKRVILPLIIYNYIKGYTNVNHSCPFKVNSNMELVNVNLDDLDIFKRFPLEDGVYGLHTLWYGQNVLIASINTSAILENRPNSNKKKI